MKKRAVILTTSAVIFTLLEAVMFYLIHIEMCDYSGIIRYLSVVVATVFSWFTLVIELLTAKSESEKISFVLLDKKGGNFIRIAMIFTLVADYFMLVLESEDNLSGVTVFLGTQLFLFLHIISNDESKKAKIANLITRIFLSFCLISVAYFILADSTDCLSIISVIYYANLCTNAIFAHRIKRGGKLLTVGLILFALCDINVGLSGLESLYEGGFTEGSLMYNLVNTDIDLIWLFYIPSQTIIPLTLLFKNK